MVKKNKVIKTWYLWGTNMGSWYKYSNILLYKIKVLKQMSKWITPKYMDLRLYTMYGSSYKLYILKHPFIFIRDINRYINWCIKMDRYR